jgi:hypothetical protein
VRHNRKLMPALCSSLSRSTLLIRLVRSTELPRHRDRRHPSLPREAVCLLFRLFRHHCSFRFKLLIEGIHCFSELGYVSYDPDRKFSVPADSLNHDNFRSEVLQWISFIHGGVGQSYIFLLRILQPPFLIFDVLLCRSHPRTSLSFLPVCA